MDSKLFSKYLVRPSDWHIYERDPSNGCYRSYSCKITYSDGTLPKASSHFTFKNLTKIYNFFAIKESELKRYEEKHKVYLNFIRWVTRSDGHGGTKGGTMQEYLKGNTCV